MHYLSVLDGITSFEESKNVLENLGLIVKEYNDLYLVKYDKSKSVMENEDVMKCRGYYFRKRNK